MQPRSIACRFAVAIVAVSSLAMALSTVACSRDLRARTAGRVPCSDENEIEIVREEYGGTHWIANCRREQYRCEGSDALSRASWVSCVHVE